MWTGWKVVDSSNRVEFMCVGSVGRVGRASVRVDCLPRRPAGAGSGSIVACCLVPGLSMQPDRLCRGGVTRG